MTPGIAEALSEDRRTFVVDPIGALSDVGGLVFNEAETLRLYLQAEAKGLESNPSNIYRLKATSHVKARNFFTLLSLGGAKRDDRAVPGWVVIDEAKKWAGTTDVNPSLMWMIDFGRNFNQGIVAVGRRPRILHRNLRQNATCAVSFKQNDASEFPGGLEGDRSKLEHIGEHEFGVLGTLPDELDALRSWQNYVSL
jgi:hypothetical protein